MAGAIESSGSSRVGDGGYRYRRAKNRRSRLSGYGLWYHGETTGWQFLNAVVPEDMKPISFYP